MGMAPETAEIVRRELKRAIELRPDYLESYGLLAFVSLVTGTELDESMEMLKQRLAGAPHRSDLRFMLAQLYLRKEDFKGARQLIDKVIAEGNADLRQSAQGLLSQLEAIEKQVARIQKEREEWESGHGRTGNSSTESVETVEHPFDPIASLRDSLRRPFSGETQEQGTLTRIDCDAKGITFVVKVNDRLLRLNTDAFEHANIVSFSEDAGNQITCGIRKTQNNVVVAYVPPTDQRARIDGVLKSLEFVPSDFKLKP
jgi:FimV-like protein